jgi:hypothetical protein
LNPNQGKYVGRRKRGWFTHHLRENKSSQPPHFPSPVLHSKEKELSSKQQQGKMEEQQGIKDGLTFPHVVLLLWKGEDVTNFSLGEGIGRVGRWRGGCSRRRVDRVSVEFSKEKT